MTDIEFVHWLNGYLEITKCKSVGTVETRVIKERLQSLFKKQTTDYSKPIEIAKAGGGVTVDLKDTLHGFNLVGTMVTC